MRPRRSLILDTTLRLVFDAALVLSVYLLFAGHNQPGGGFVGGLVAGGALGLRDLAGGLDEVRATLPGRPWHYLSAGLLVAVGMALRSLVGGGAPLDQTAYTGDLLVIGTAKLTTATIFDVGVYLIVVGLVLLIFEGLGEHPSESPVPEEHGS